MDSDCETALLMPKELEEKIYNYVENGTWPPATPPAPLPSVFEEFEPLDEEDPREDERVEASAEIDYVMDERIIARFADVINFYDDHMVIDDEKMMTRIREQNVESACDLLRSTRAQPLTRAIKQL
ncbi:hypothetical protein RB195_021529 [Necator americanus]|uniref:MCM N-terminal domain-containing protein n=1 Tax=Necator americanus TaxID=51031 RepID=A0ABR1EBK2_NECAM